MKKIALIFVLSSIVVLLLIKNIPRGPIHDTTPNAEIVERDIEEVIVAQGTVRSLSTTSIKSEVHGKITKIQTRNGSFVKRGDLLITLDTIDLRAAVEEGKKLIEAAELNLEKTKADLDRIRELNKEGYATARELKEIETIFKIGMTNLDIEKARLQGLETQLEKTKIRAPHDGIVNDLELTEGQVIVGANSYTMGTPLLELNDVSRYTVQFDLNEIDVAKVQVAQMVEVSFDSLPGMSLTSEISNIATSPKAGTKMTVFPVHAVFKSVGNAQNIKLGISANIKITGEKKLKVPSVRITSVFVEDGKHVVYIKKDGRFNRKEVEVGVSDLYFVEIMGVAPKELVALERP